MRERTVCESMSNRKKAAQINTGLLNSLCSQSENAGSDALGDNLQDFNRQDVELFRRSPSSTSVLEERAKQRTSLTERLMDAFLPECRTDLEDGNNHSSNLQKISPSGEQKSSSRNGVLDMFVQEELQRHGILPYVTQELSLLRMEREDMEPMNTQVKNARKLEKSNTFDGQRDFKRFGTNIE